jgi:hypothetical protein
MDVEIARTVPVGRLMIALLLPVFLLLSLVILRG